MENHKRALRRHHTARIKRNRQYYWGRGKPNEQMVDVNRDTYRLNPVGGVTVLADKYLGLVVNTPQVCSCFRCGNPRRFGHRTLKEALVKVCLSEGLDEI